MHREKSRMQVGVLTIESEAFDEVLPHANSSQPPHFFIRTAQMTACSMIMWRHIQWKVSQSSHETDDLETVPG